MRRSVGRAHTITKSEIERRHFIGTQMDALVRPKNSLLRFELDQYGFVSTNEENSRRGKFAAGNSGGPAMSMSHKLAPVVATVALFVVAPPLTASANVIGITSVAQLGFDTGFL
jgi:hypothetical protein